MPVERDLTTHFAACLASDDSGCIPAFIDRVMETRSEAVREDAEFFEQSHSDRPVLELRSRFGDYEAVFIIDFEPWSDTEFAVNPGQEIDLKYGVRRNGRGHLKYGTPCDPPPQWNEHDIADVMEILRELKVAVAKLDHLAWD